MKKCFLKMITTILACALIFLSSSNILAATPTRAESDYLSNQSLYYAHEALNLEISNPQSSYYCCEPSAIEYGNPIPAYYYSNNIYEEESTVLIPIFFDDVLCLIAHVFYRHGEFTGVELTDDLVAELRQYDNMSIALVSQANSVFLYQEQGRRVEVLKTYNYLTDIATVHTANSVQDYPLNSDYLSLVCSPLEKKFSFCQLNSINSFEYISAADPVNYLSTAPNSYNLGCTIVQQHGLPICWAATVASIGLKLTGISRSAEYVSNYMLGEYDGGNTYLAALALQQIYGLSTSDNYYAPYFSQIQTEIYDYNRPIYVRVCGTAGSHSDEINHALFIDGYQVVSSGNLQGMLSVADPNYSYFRSIYFTNDQVYPYSLGTRSGYIDEFILVS